MDPIRALVRVAHLLALVAAVALVAGGYIPLPFPTSVGCTLDPVFGDLAADGDGAMLVHASGINISGTLRLLWPAGWRVTADGPDSRVVLTASGSVFGRTGDHVTVGAEADNNPQRPGEPLYRNGALVVCPMTVEMMR